MGKRTYPLALRSRAGWSDYLDARRHRQPHLHQIEPTNHCPYACVMCPRDQRMTRELGFMEMSLYRKVIDEVAGYDEPVRSREIELFHFGESLLHPQIDEMIGYASQRGLNIVLSVNAPQLTPEMVDRILARHPRRLIVSLDGHDAATYRALRGPNADYTAAVRNLGYLATRVSTGTCSAAVCVRIIRMHANADQVEAFEQNWRQQGLEVEVRPFFPWTEKDLADLGEVEKYPPGMHCPFPWEYLVVQWDGTVVPCCRDYNAVNIMGNAREQSLEEIWNSTVYAGFREQHRCGDYRDNRFCLECMEIFYTEPATPDALATGAGVASSAGDTLDQLWRSAVSTHADRPLMIDAADGSRFSYADADEVVVQVAARLLQAGLRRGDRLVVCAHQHVEAALLFWGAVRLGVTFVPIDPRLPAGLLEDLLAETEPRLCFCDLVTHKLLGESSRIPLVVFDDPEDQPVAGAQRFADWLGEGEPTVAVAAPTPEAPAVILFTSGTSGRPKGVVLSHGALCRSGALMARSYRWQVGDLLWSLGDFHTMSGLRNPCIATLHAGAAFLVAPPETRGNALVVAEELQRHGVTILATVPALLRQFLRLATRLGNQPLVGVRQVFCTGSILTPEVEAAFRKRFMVPVYNYYGLTETAGLCLGIIPGNRAEAGAIGWPIGSEILIVDDDGSPAPDGEAGELLVRSNNLMSGYFRGRQPHDVSSLRDGWYVTGDLARRNPDGSITLLGRISDAIKDVRGELLHPAEIERALERHPLVAEAGVCGIAGPDGEERLAACIVPAVKVTAEESFLSEVRQNLFEILGPTRLPARFQLVAELPRGTGGKLLRGQLSELLSEEGNGV